MRDGYVKDAAHDVAEDVTQDAAEGVLGAAAAAERSPSHPWPAQLPLTPKPPKFLHQRLFHRRAKRSLNV